MPDIHKYAKRLQNFYRVNKKPQTRDTVACMKTRLYDEFGRKGGDELIQSKPFQKLVGMVEKSTLVHGRQVKQKNSIIDGYIKKLGSKYLRNYAHTIKAFANSRIPNIQNLSDELKYIEKTFDEFNLIGDGAYPWNNILSITTDNIIIKDYDFGKFKIKLSCDKLGFTEDRVQTFAIPLDPQYPGNDYAHPHPHVELNNLCVGEGHPVAAAALLHGRIGDYFHIITSVLNTYGQESPYRFIEAWIGGDCCDCGDSMDGESTCHCDECSAISCTGCCHSCVDCDECLCWECTSHCSICESNVCSECRYVCERCSGHVCSNCVVKCNGCCEWICENCIGDECDHCGIVRCESCRPSCSQCGETFCPECSGCCYGCGGNFCSSCLSWCFACNGSFCESCGTKCGDCDKIVCESCSETCWNCSKSVCDNCATTCEMCEETLCSSCECCDDEE